MACIEDLIAGIRNPTRWTARPKGETRTGRVVLMADGDQVFTNDIAQAAKILVRFEENRVVTFRPLDKDDCEIGEVQ